VISATLPSSQPIVILHSRVLRKIAVV